MTLYEDVLEYLRASSHRGSQVDQIAIDLGVNGPCVTEVLEALVKDGLVTIITQDDQEYFWAVEHAPEDDFDLPPDELANAGADE